MRNDALIRTAMASSAGKQADEKIEKLLADFDTRILAAEQQQQNQEEVDQMKAKNEDLTKQLAAMAADFDRRILAAEQQKQQEMDQLKTKNAELTKQLAAAKNLLSKV